MTQQQWQAPDPYRVQEAPPPTRVGSAAGPPPEPARTDGLAVAGLVLAVLVAPVGLVLSILALRRASPARRGLPITGVVVSGVVILLGLLVAALAVLGGFLVSSFASAPTEAAPVPPSTLALGGSARIDDLSVAVDAVDLDATEELAAVDDNPPAVDQYVLVDITVTNEGALTTDPWVALATRFVGTDGYEYWDDGCAAYEPRSVVDVGDVAPGETVSYQVCLDVPREAIEGGHVLVGSWESDDTAYWRTGS